MGLYHWEPIFLPLNIGSQVNIIRTLDLPSVNQTILSISRRKRKTYQ